MEDVSGRIARKVRILSPFDNAVIQRERLAAIFNYSYQIECYVPRPKRVHGYFVLPILYGDRFVGRMDAKADRKTGIFNILSLYLETERSIEDILWQLASSIRSFADWHGSMEIIVHDVQPLVFKDELVRLLNIN